MSTKEYNSLWHKEGVNSISPSVYRKYIENLYHIQELTIDADEFLDVLSTSLSFTPFSSEKIIFVKEMMKLGEQVARFEIDISDVCNFKCPGCTFQYNQKDMILPFDVIKAFISEIKKLQISAVTLVGGGDPTQYNDSGVRLPDVADEFKRNGIETFLVTNGYDLEDDDIKRLVQTVSGIRISYYDFIAPGEPSDKHEVVHRNIKRIVEYKYKLNSNVLIMIGNLVSYNNPKDFQTTLELAKTFGVTITPRPFISINKTANDRNPNTTNEILKRTL
jgi:MoaA/NifB/PqqE/SkfB family radical SAM enzyme